MYVLLIGGIFAVALWSVLSGLRSGRRAPIARGIAIGLGGLGLVLLLDLSAELYWYQSLGYESRFWIFVWARIGAVVVGAASAGIAAYLI
ncbi:MAG: hypothetical protein PVF57_15220, partial [Pseudomonadales bacterium]